VAAAIKPDDNHFARTRLLCLENTMGGKVLPLEYLHLAREFANANKLGLHLDGARAFNAAVKLGVSIDAISRHFDTVSLCLSKGLGAPVGSVLCGKRGLIARARRWRKVVGGGMRQAGILAAAGIIALKQHVERLAEDHANARRLAEGLAGIPALEVDPSSVQTNMVFCTVADSDMRPLQAHLKANGILVGSGNPLRLVTHLDISAGDVDTTVAAFGRYFAA
jgi:threonine aldolase